jgi:beta-lactamase class D
MTPSGIHRLLWSALALLSARPLWGGAQPPGGLPPTPATRSCFLLYEVGNGEVRRNPSTVCAARMSPQSTFKIPHALAGLDAGVLPGADATYRYDGTPQPFASWRRDHTLASALRNSVVWYFQRLASQLGPARERDYLRRFEYGNGDSSSGLTAFWLGGSLEISADEQMRFLRRLYADELPISHAAMTTVKRLLVLPGGWVTIAAGEHAFAAPWPSGAIVSAKTGSGDNRDGHQVRWIVGHVARGDRSWIFVSSLVGGDDTPALAAVDQAARALREEGVLR